LFLSVRGIEDSDLAIPSLMKSAVAARVRPRLPREMENGRIV